MDEQGLEDRPNPTQIEVLSPRGQVRPFPQVVLVVTENEGVQPTLEVPREEVLHPIPIGLSSPLRDVHLVQDRPEHPRQVHRGQYLWGLGGGEEGGRGGVGHGVDSVNSLKSQLITIYRDLDRLSTPHLSDCKTTTYGVLGIVVHRFSGELELSNCQ